MAVGSIIRPPGRPGAAGLTAVEPEKPSSVACRCRRCIRSSRRPLEKGGRPPSADFGSGKTLGRLAPLSTAGQPISVRRIGFEPGTQAVGAASRTPPTRS